MADYTDVIAQIKGAPDFATLDKIVEQYFAHATAGGGALYSGRVGAASSSDFVEGWYNPHRRHSALGYLSPNNFERRMSEAA